jgi:ORF6N domain
MKGRSLYPETPQASPTRPRATVSPIESRIAILRHQKVILDAALAEIYGVSVKRLNQQVNRNRERFPRDFMFQLKHSEFANLRLQFATSRKGHGGRRSLPYAFTEHGVIMAATVLNSEQAVRMSVYVVRAFVRLREALAANKELAAKLAELEKHLETHDGTIQKIIDILKRLMNPPPSRRRKIGFCGPHDPDRVVAMRAAQG